MPRVLVISFSYPPGFGSGSVRVSKFVKYLPQFNWEPIVLTVDPAKYQFRGGLESLLHGERIVTTDFFDPLAWARALYPLEQSAGVATAPSKPSLLGRLRPLIRGLKPLAKPIWDFIYFPDPQIGWMPYALRAGHEIIVKSGIDVIFSSSPPNTGHLVAAYLSERFHIPWIAEYRDPWSDHHTISKAWPLPMIDRWLERRTLSHAAAVESVSRTTANILSKKLRRPVEVIENGFDPDDVPTGTPSGTPSEDLAKDEPFMLLHAGTIYRVHRNPAMLFEALRDLRQSMSLTSARFQAHFVGVGADIVSDMARDYGVSDLVRAIPREPYESVIRRQAQATALLLIGVSNALGGGVLTGKLFEYFGQRKPVLGMGAPDPELADLIDRTRVGKFHTDAVAVASTLRHWIESYETTGAVPYEPNETEVMKYSRRGAAEKLAAMLTDSLRAGSPARF